MHAHTADQIRDTGVLSGNTIRRGRSDTIDFLEHLDPSIEIVLARLDLTPIHAES